MNLVVTLCSPVHIDDRYDLRFAIADTQIANKWAKRLLLAQSKDIPVDDPFRFYGFGTMLEETNKALDNINRCIDIINADRVIISKRLDDVNDTDTLNYLHHVFEKYHGLLDSQNTDFWLNSLPSTKKALADLNIAVHRVETVHYGNKPRFTVTYFPLPKTEFLEPEDYRWLTNDYSFGGLYLNYVEIGKTLEDLMRDNDHYIDPDAFQPWQRFSADFTVKMHTTDPIKGKEHRNACEDYFRLHKEFFNSIGYFKYEDRLKPGAIHIGQLLYSSEDEIVTNIKSRQMIFNVKIEE